MEFMTMPIRIELCQPRCYVLMPKLTRDDANKLAGARAEKVFGLLQRFRKEHVDAKLIQLRLLPFWYVKCSSFFHYDRENTYIIHPKDDDASEITILGANTVFLVNKDAKPSEVVLHGIEQCITTKTEDENIESAGSFGISLEDDKKLDEYKRAQRRTEIRKMFEEYRGSSAQEVDFSSFYGDSMIGSVSISSWLAGEKIQILLPDKLPNRVVGDVMKKVMAEIEPLQMHDNLLSVLNCDLFYRPVYIFEFQKTEDKANPLLEQLDAISGNWTPIKSRDVKQPGVQADKVLLLTVEAASVVIKELGGPWTRIAAGLIEVGAKHLPGIIDDMKSQ